jgi:cyclic beta-1,2-glucan synthetase
MAGLARGLEKRAGMKSGIVTAYFVKHDEARGALRELGRRGFRRAALIHKTADGHVRTLDPFARRRAAAVILSAALLGALAGAAFLASSRQWPASGAGLAIAAWIGPAALLGAALGWAWMGRSRHGVERRLITDHSRWLVTEETVLILQAPINQVRFPVAVLRKTGEIPPVVSFLNPRRESLLEEAGTLGAPLPPAQMQELAIRLAVEGSIDENPRRNTRLLQRLRQARQWIHVVCKDLSEEALLEQRTTPLAEWILDNEYIIEGNVRDVQQNLSRRFYQALPVLKDKPYRGLPRIYGLAKELVSHAGLRLDRENTVAFVEAYQSVRTLTIAELWAIPQMLRIALIEGIQDLEARALAELRDREIADFWANRLITASRRDPNRLFAIMGELAESEPAPSRYFAFHLIDHLYDEEPALAPVQSWLERIYQTPLGELSSREQNRQTKDQISIGNAFTSLRQLAILDWRQIFEHVSRVERLLRQDPSGIYAGMDFATRDRYRRVVEEIARRSGQDEEKVARSALELAARAARGPVGEKEWAHVGTWLVGEGRPELARAADCREAPRFRVMQWARRHHSAVYFLGLGLVSALFLLLILLLGLRGQAWEMRVLVALLALFPVSQLALEVVNYLVMRVFPPRTLAKMDFQVSGIPDAFRTLVVVPMLLEDPQTIGAEVDRLEIRYLANREDNLLFGLFADFTDAEEAHLEQDEPLLRYAISRLESLNERHGSERFYLFHRERTWSQSEQKHIGWERKRGKLEELNRLIDGTRPQAAGQLVVVGHPERLADVRFVITLDSDTQLPSGTARRMIETLAHPLNQARFDEEGRILPGSYTIIQPRVSPSLPSTSATPFSRLFSHVVGIDPYTRAVSDVNQDLAGEGSYHGKGIYDVHAFSKALSGRFPEEWLLSHDLIEGAHVRVGLASDIELLDEFPRDYLTYARRQHRWIRGDWQIADWIRPHVPRSEGRRGVNQLSWFNRWKILDNLRRSLIPAASLALLAVAWLTSPGIEAICALVVVAQLFFQTLAQPLTSATTRHGLKRFSPSKAAHDLLRTVVEAALIPHQAWLALNAIARVWYRRLISHRHLLEWTPAPLLRRRAVTGLPGLLLAMGLVSVLSAIVAGIVYRWAPANFVPAGPWLGLWFLSPLIGWLLNLPPRGKPRRSGLPARDLMYLRKIARRTWRFFSDFVSEETSWLPPDNYQVFHQDQLAMRTSPTNIGLWMLSALAARDFGYWTGDQVLKALRRSMETIATLERHEGHLLNWYDLQTLRPLEPRYVSTVDSGNLLGALCSLEHGLEELVRRPVLDESFREGLRDTGDVFREAAALEGGPRREAEAVEKLTQLSRASVAGIVDELGLLRRLERASRAMSEGAPRAVERETGSSYWAGQMEAQITAWGDIRDRYLTWIEILGEKTEAEMAPLGEEASSAVRRDREHAPSLHDLATGNVACIPILRSLRELPSPAAHPLLEWMDRVIPAFDTSKWLAGETLDLAEKLVQNVRELSNSISMRFLYDTRRKLFAIGFNVSDSRLDSAFYDLLASESRIGSYMAIARGEVPLEHWFAMGRPYNAVGRRRVLLSWTGTMFEYLMPLLLQRSYGGSLLDKATREAVAIHIGHGRKLGVPWGISESAFTDLDNNKTYQYRAFGVPELGLKRGGEEPLVVTPHASLLAVAIAPRKTVKNLKRLASQGLLNAYGYYEAVDFSRQPTREGGRGVIVRAYMAHHQGMGLLSLDNFLHGNPTQRHFHADARVRAVEPLLHESIPVLPPLYHISTRQRGPSADDVREIAPSMSRFDSPHTRTPKTQLLGNGRYSLMVTNSGGGYSQWGDFEITRWRSDRTRDSWGQWSYIHEPDSDRLWSTAYHPVGGKVEAYTASFTLDRAVFRRVDNGIETETEIAVSAEDDVEIRRITLTNRSIRTRHLDLTSCVELSLAGHRADLQHPAFNKLFIETEAVAEHRALLASRRPRGEGDSPVFVAHRITVDPPEGTALRFETDRRSFIGRGRTLERPAGAVSEPGGSQGFVLDPILSLRHSLALGPGERAQASLILAAGDSRQKVLGLMDKYGDVHAIDRAMDFAWASAQLELRLLRVHPDEARRFQEIASHLLFPNPLLRAPAERIEKNRKGQAGLWRYGISGDLPIAVVSIGEPRDIGLVRQMLLAHSFWRSHGLKADLVILDEEASGYERPLHEQLETLIRSTSGAAAEKRGAVFLRTTDQLPEEDLALIMAAASVVLVAARGTLPQQMGVEAALPEAQDFLARRRPPRDPSAPLPFMELPYFNGTGGFTSDGREYAIYLGPGTFTPAPWVNILSNPAFGTLVSETGSGFTWFGNSQRNRMTDWSNDPVTDPPSEALYIRDEETGVYWTPTRSPISEDSAYRARHGAGYTVFEHNSHGIEQELTVFVPVDESGGQPIKLQRLRLRNDTSRTRILSLTYYVEWTLGENRESSQMHVTTSWDDEMQVLLARNRYHPEYGDRVGFATMSPSPLSFDGDRTSFIGRNRSLSYPAAMERMGLSMRTGAGMDPCAALQTVIEMAPGEKAELTCMMGQAGSAEEVHRLVLPYRNAGAAEAALEKTKAWWDEQLGTVEVHTPELAADFLINRWLLYQSLSCRVWGRSATYQSGGAFGFRDQLQDVMALLYARPETAREHILRAASRQFTDGDVQHWWHPPNGAGIRSRISDDLLWLPHAVAQYVRVTGDTDILDTVVPFLSAAPLEAEQREVFSTPEVSAEGATLFDHCRRAVSRGLTSGPHGLPLMGTGDWNDGMDSVGARGRGESVWLGWFLVDVLQGMAELSAARGRAELGRSFEEERKALVQRIEAAGWDGEWYLRAFFDDGTPLGSSASVEGKIDSIPQSWASLSGAADPDRVRRALDSAWGRLVREEDGLVQLFDPPFETMEPSPGYIKGYPPGVRENGGQYTHAAVWLAMALARQQDGERAARVLRLLNPIEHTGGPEAALRYAVEPYVIAADVYRLPGRIGQGGWSWYTGSAAWMYRAWVEEILGLKIRGDLMRLEPVIPGWWHDFSMRYRHGEAVYEIQVENPDGREHGVAWAEMDGRRLVDECIPLERVLVKHRILVHMGERAPR